MKSKTISKPAATTSAKRKGRKDARSTLELTLLALPALLLVFAFSYVPMPGLVLVFKQYNFRDGIWGSPWNGLKNFQFVFSNKLALDSIRNTVLYNFVWIFLGLAIGVGLALVMNNIISRKALKVYQTAIFIPHYLSWSIITYIVAAFLGNKYGMINVWLENLGLDKIRFYEKKEYWPFLLTFLHFWKGFGYSTLLYYARMLGIDPSYYEAAALDGASRWQQARYITIPCLSPIILISLINSFGRIFNSDFSLFWMVPMRNSMIMEVTTTLDTYSYSALQGGTSLSLGASAGFFQSVAGLILILCCNTFIRRTFGKDRAMF